MGLHFFLKRGSFFILSKGGETKSDEKNDNDGKDEREWIVFKDFTEIRDAFF